MTAFSGPFDCPTPIPATEFYSYFSFETYFIAEDSFLAAIINYTNSSTVHFKLSPTYVLYMACRYVLSSQYRPDVSASERPHRVIAIVSKMVSMMESVIQVSVPGPSWPGVGHILRVTSPEVASILRVKSLFYTDLAVNVSYAMLT